MAHMSRRRLARVLCRQLLCPLIKTLLLASVVASVGTVSADELTAEAIWQRIGPFFSPPPEMTDDFGDYRSPLKFYDGQPVRNAEDWKRHREEILSTWHRMMGPWPEVIEDPKVDYLESERRENFTQQRIRFLLMPEHFTESYLLTPDGEDRRPAVVVVYYDPETGIGRGKENRDFAYQLAKRGFVTLSIGHRPGLTSDAYPLYSPPKEQAAIQPLSALAHAAANAYHVMASRPEVDEQRIGIVGHSYGGKWAMFASCLYDKYACAAWSDGGIVFDESRPSVNYWEPWYLGYEAGVWRTRGVPTEKNPRIGLYKRLVEENYDLHELHALMAPRPFLVSGGSEDSPKRWIPLNHAIAVNKLLGYENRVAMTNRPLHSPNPESNEQVYLFFEYFLKHNRIADR